MPTRRRAFRHRLPGCLLVLLGLVALPWAGGGCYTKRMARMEGRLDTLQITVDSLSANQAVAIARLQQSLEQQRELMHSLRAGTNLASKDIIERMEILSAKLDDTADRIWRMGGGARVTVPVPVDSAAGGGDGSGTAPSDVDPQTLYEQAAKDFTQGRFEMALAGFRQLLAAAPAHNYADNALYGVGESFYALARYDSAEIAYRAVADTYPRGDKVPASLYKLGMTYEKMGRRAEAKDTFLRLRQDYPRSGEAILAEERLKELERF